MTREELDDQFKAQAAQLALEIDVLSSGPVNAHIAIVGEGPGETEVRRGQPFVGGSGELLWNALRKYSLHRANVYTTNVVKRQISLSRSGNERHVVHRSELDKWIGLVKWELEQLPNLRHVFLMGNYALEAFTGHKGITDWRGSVLDGMIGQRPVRLITTINPAYALRELKMEPMFMMDCHKLDLVNRNTFKEHRIDVIINPTYNEALAYIRHLGKGDKPISLDVEHIRETYCYGLANDAHRAICINFRDNVQNRYTVSEEVDLLHAIQALCDSHRIIVQNGNHEISWCRMHDLIAIEPWFDTMLAHHLLYPQMPHSLQFMTAQYTTHPFYKDEGWQWKEGGNINDFWIYNGKDAAVTYAIHEKMAGELSKRGLDKFFHDHVMRAQLHLGSATVHGMAVDHDIKDFLVRQIGEDVGDLLAEFHRLVQDATDDPSYFPNPGSWQQLQGLFFDRLKLKGRGRSTDKINREHMLKHPETTPIAKEILAAINKWSTESKFLGTFAAARLGDDGRMHCAWRQSGVQRAPGRLSSASMIDGQGMNMQNQPVRARAMYVADPGCVLIYFDLKQAEAQVVGYRYRIEKWKAQYEKARKDNDYDAHRALASEMFKVPYELVPVADLDEDGLPTKRYIAKRCRHGLNYRMQSFRLSEVTGLPYHEARRAFALYHSITPELQKGWAQEERVFKADKVLVNAFGRELKVIQRIDEDVLESIVAFYPQSTIGDKVTQVWYQSESDDKWPKEARICLNVHDNLVGISAPERTAKTALSIMKRYAEQPIMIQDAFKGKPEPLIIPAETKMSYPTIWEWNEKEQKLVFTEDVRGLHRWSHMKDIHL